MQAGRWCLSVKKRPKILYRTWTTVVISLTNTTAGSDCQTLSGHIPGDEPEQGIDGYRRKKIEKRRVLRWEWRTPWEMPTSGPGSERDDGDELCFPWCIVQVYLHYIKAACTVVVSAIYFSGISGRRGGTVDRASDLWYTGRGFESWLGTIM